MVTYPKDWGESELGILFDVSAGGDVDRSYFSKNKTIKHPYEIFSNGIDNRGLYGYTSKPLHDGDSITVTARGTIGKAFYRSDPYDAIIRLLVLAPKSNDVSSMFYTYFINNNIVFEDEHTGVPQLTAPKIKRINMPKPSLPEQKAIAATLSCIDTHIANLTELIEKKEAIRDGALEDLLSGRTRLVGFCGEWEEYSFDDYFTLLPNNTLSREKLSERGTIGNIHYGDVLIKYHNNVTDKDDIPRIKADIDTRSFRLLQSGDIIVADTAEDETVGKAIQICDVSIPLVGGLHTIVCRPNYDTALGYLGYYINSKNYHNQLFPHITGIKVSSISKKAIKTTVLNLPKDIDEQKAIVEVLSSLDAEIASLEEEKDKMMQIKAGAMDDLLTGRVRLMRQGG